MPYSVPIRRKANANLASRVRLPNLDPNVPLSSLANDAASEGTPTPQSVTPSIDADSVHAKSPNESSRDDNRLGFHSHSALHIATGAESKSNEHSNIDHPNEVVHRVRSSTARLSLSPSPTFRSHSGHVTKKPSRNKFIHSAPLAEPMVERVQGTWSDRTAGGHCKLPTWRNNPQFGLKLRASANTKITLRQSPMPAPASPKPLTTIVVDAPNSAPVSVLQRSPWAKMGFYVCHCTPSMRGTVFCFQKDNLVAVSQFVEEETVLCELSLPVSTSFQYVIVPCLEQPGLEAQFELSVESDQPFTIERSPAVWQWHAVETRGSWTVPFDLLGDSADSSGFDGPSASEHGSDIVQRSRLQQLSVDSAGGSADNATWHRNTLYELRTLEPGETNVAIVLTQGHALPEFDLPSAAQRPPRIWIGCYLTGATDSWLPSVDDITHSTEPFVKDPCVCIEAVLSDASQRPALQRASNQPPDQLPYLIIPSTYEPQEEGIYSLVVYSDKRVALHIRPSPLQPQCWQQTVLEDEWSAVAASENKISFQWPEAAPSHHTSHGNASNFAAALGTSPESSGYSPHQLSDPGFLSPVVEAETTPPVAPKDPFSQLYPSSHDAMLALLQSAPLPDDSVSSLPPPRPLDIGNASLGRSDSGGTGKLTLSVSESTESLADPRTPTNASTASGAVTNQGSTGQPGHPHSLHTQPSFRLFKLDVTKRTQILISLFHTDEAPDSDPTNEDAGCVCAGFDVLRAADSSFAIYRSAFEPRREVTTPTPLTLLPSMGPFVIACAALEPPEESSFVLSIFSNNPIAVEPL